LRVDKTGFLTPSQTVLLVGRRYHMILTQRGVSLPQECNYFKCLNVRSSILKFSILYNVRSNPSISIEYLFIKYSIDILGLINLWIRYRLHVCKVTVYLRRCPYLSINMVATNTGRDNQLHPTVTKRQ